MIKRLACLFCTLALIALFSAPAQAVTVLKRAEADKYLGDIKEKIFAGHYTYEVLSRSHRDAMHGRFSDALLFNTDGGHFEYLRRKDGNHIVLIDSPGGRQEDPVTEDAWRNKISNVLSDDNNIPFIILDDSNQEIAIVFVGKGTQVNAKRHESGYTQITIEVDSARDSPRGRRLRIM